MTVLLPSIDWQSMVKSVASNTTWKAHDFAHSRTPFGLYVLSDFSAIALSVWLVGAPPDTAVVRRRILMLG